MSQFIPEYDTYLGYPAIIGRDGIVETIKLNLTTDELSKLQESANYIKEKFASYNN